MAAQVGRNATSGPGIRQRDIALKKDETYTLSLYARGSGSVTVTFEDGDAPVFTKTFTGLTDQWQKFTVEFNSPRSVDAAVVEDRSDCPRARSTSTRSPSSPPRPWPPAAIAPTCSRPSPTCSPPPSAGPAGALPTDTSGRTASARGKNVFPIPSNSGATATPISSVPTNSFSSARRSGPSRSSY